MQYKMKKQKKKFYQIIKGEGENLIEKRFTSPPFCGIIEKYYYVLLRPV